MAQAVVLKGSTRDRNGAIVIKDRVGDFTEKQLKEGEKLGVLRRISAAGVDKAAKARAGADDNPEETGPKPSADL